MAGIDPRFYYLTLGLLALCTVAGLVVAIRWQREVNHDLAPPTDKDLLDPIEKAYYSGLMREEEYQRIRESMAKQMSGVALPLSKAERLKARPPAVAGPESTVESEGPTADPSTEDLPPPIIPTGDSAPGPGPG